jgi:hypothetical protein
LHFLKQLIADNAYAEPVIRDGLSNSILGSVRLMPRRLRNPSRSVQPDVKRQYGYYPDLPWKSGAAVAEQAAFSWLSLILISVNSETGLHNWI